MSIITLSLRDELEVLRAQVSTVNNHINKYGLRAPLDRDLSRSASVLEDRALSVRARIALPSPLDPIPTPSDRVEVAAAQSIARTILTETLHQETVGHISQEVTAQVVTVEPN